MKNKIKLLIFVSIMAVLFLSVNAAANGTCGANLTWTLDDSGTLTISGTGDMTDWTKNSDIPWYNSGVKTVIIEDGVTSVGLRAFYKCDSLTSITLPNSVASIGNYAFFRCSNLASITIPTGVTSIGDYTFYSCTTLTSVTIPNTVTSIGNKAFYSCSKLTDVYYSGSRGDWAGISIGSSNTKLINAAIHYNYPAKVSFNTSNGKITVDSENSVSSAVLIASIYTGGKLIDAKTANISLIVGENTFDSPITDFSGADTIKIFVWSSLSEMNPLFKYELELT